MSATITLFAIDDEPFLLKLLRSMLARLGHSDVHCFERAEEALSAMASGLMPQVILLDINMPGMDGVECVRQLAERGYAGGVILVSGEDESMLRAATMLARVRGLTLAGSLRKPPNPEQLSSLIDKSLEETSRRLGRSPVANQERRYEPEEVHQAISNGQLVNYYQPKVSVTTGEVVGVETLVRWNHPRDGIVSPYFFVGVAESNGFIHELTNQVFRSAVRQANEWQQMGLPPLRVAVNLSMDDLTEVNSADFIINETLNAGVTPPSIVLEVTESRLMRDLATVLDVLARLHLKRFRLSIDDFGTGHSSLVILRDLLFDELKIDAGFVHNAWRNERLASFFKASLDLARHLGMEAVAEGVEDRQDWEFVRDNGCHLVQGYFVAKPMPASELAGWIPRWSRRLLEESLLSS